MGAEATSPGASIFENFILLQLVFEQERFEPRLVFQFFDGETRITWPIAPKICTKVVPYVPHLRSKFQVAICSCFKVIAISASGCRKKVNFARKKTKGFPTQSVAEVPIMMQYIGGFESGSNQSRVKIC